jgi:uncharacterized protein (DUF1778 family)
MARDVAPVCFRLSGEDRELLEQAALFRETSMSQFIRDIAISTASQIVEDNREAILIRMRQQAEEIQQQYEKKLERISAQVDGSSNHKEMGRSAGARRLNTERVPDLAPGTM